jgi:hypothetical protein
MAKVQHSENFLMDYQGDDMLFQGTEPVTVLHRKVNGERYCICGAELKFCDGEWIHPPVE